MDKKGFRYNAFGVCEFALVECVALYIFADSCSFDCFPFVWRPIYTKGILLFVRFASISELIFVASPLNLPPQCFRSREVWWWSHEEFGLPSTSRRPCSRSGVPWWSTTSLKVCWVECSTQCTHLRAYLLLLRRLGERRKGRPRVRHKISFSVVSVLL